MKKQVVWSEGHVQCSKCPWKASDVKYGLDGLKSQAESHAERKHPGESVMFHLGAPLWVS